MKFTLKKASDWHFEKEVEVNDIADLKAISKEYGEESLVIDFFNMDKRITIYDDWIGE